MARAIYVAPVHVHSRCQLLAAQKRIVEVYASQIGYLNFVSVSFLWHGWIRLNANLCLGQVKNHRLFSLIDDLEKSHFFRLVAIHLIQ